MTDDSKHDSCPDPDKLTGPGGMTMRQVYEKVQQSVQRDQEAQAAHKSTSQTNRWRRWVRYVWGRSGRR
jgi:hypothetical protein